MRCSCEGCGEPFFLGYHRSVWLLWDPQELVLVERVECTNCRLKLIQIPHATFEHLLSASHCGECFSVHWHK